MRTHSALLVLLAQQPWDAVVAQAAASSLPTAYVDIHLVTSVAGTLEQGYIFRVAAAESTFGGSPPKGPAWSTHSALTGGAGREANVDSAAYPAHRLLLPPAADAFLCNEAEGLADYKNPSGNAGMAMFDPDNSDYAGSYLLVPRGHCTFEAKARSAQRLGAAGVIVRNTLASRYSLIDEDAAPALTGGPDWGNTRWPVAQRDYECGDGKTAAGGVGWRAEVAADQLAFRPAPYVGAANDALLAGTAADGNLCAANASDFVAHCPSRRCLLTGHNASAGALEACCAWDTFVRMGGDGDDDGDAVPADDEEAIEIPALFVTVEHGEELYEVVMDAARQAGAGLVEFVHVVPYGRWHPMGHIAGVVVWALAVAALWYAARASAREYRASWKKISRAMNDGVLVFHRGAGNTPGRERAETEDTVDLAEETIDFELAAPEVEMTTAGAGTVANGEAVVPTTPGEGFSISDDANEDDFVGSGDGASPPPAPLPEDLSFAPPAERRAPPASPSPTARREDARRLNAQSAPAPPAVQLGAVHGLLFVAAASSFLFVLFFFDLDRMIRILYGLGGAVAMHQIVFHPLYAKVLVEKKLGGVRVAIKLTETAFANLPGCRGVHWTWLEVASSGTGIALGLAWIAVGLTWVQPMTSVYYWFIQDVMGVCFCVLIMGLIQINTIMVASVLLSLVFVYDVFHVLVSPYIFGSSVMVDVAMGSSSQSLSYCLKYPLEKACKGRFAPLPQLLAFPWMNDFRGGFSMLGLGDIILPGLLVSFAARYDAATALVRKCAQASARSSGGGDTDHDITSGNYSLGRLSKALFQGYFGPLTIAYGVGLMLAYVVVWTTQTGQPALLYIVPATLGTIFFLGFRRRELSDLWSGPKVMKKANRMVAVASNIPEAPLAALPSNSVMV